MGIRQRRIELGLRQDQLAELAGLSPHSMRMLERGLAPLEAVAGRRIARALRVPLKTLLAEHAQHAKSATPGEGYTTAEAGEGEIIQRSRSVPSKARTVLDIFCGAGGLSYGFEQTQEFITSCGIDLLPDRIASFVANHPFATGIAGDLRAFSLDRLAQLAGRVDVLVGGPPCQGFSSIRPFRTLTEGDPRNSLVEHYVLAIAKLKPDWFVFENVVGILTHEGGQRLHAVVEGLKAAGYVVDWRIVNAALFGVPQHRERLVIVGNLLGIPFSWPMPTNHVEHKSMAGSRPEVLRTHPLFARELLPPVSLMDAISDLPPVDAGCEVTEYASVGALTAFQREMRANSPGLTLHRATRHSERMLTIIRHAGANISALPPGMVKSGFSSCYSRLHPDRPSTTMTVNFVHPASNRCIHPYQHRALTPREGARIQSFPDRFEFRGSAAQIVKQIGNAVPPKLGKAIALAILESEARHCSPRSAASRG